MNKYLFIAPVRPDKISGPLNSVSSLVKGLIVSGHHVRFFSLGVGCTENFSYNGVDLEKFSLRRIIKHSADSITILTGLYSVKILFLCLLLTVLGRKVIFSTRGNLSLASFSKSPVRKKIYLFLAKPLLERVSAIHYLSNKERLNSMPLKNRNFLCPNIVNFDPTYHEVDCFKQRNNSITYIGRLDILHKGLDLLIQFASDHRRYLLQQRFKIFIYGPGRGNDRIILEELVTKNNLNSLVEIRNPVVGEEKFEILRRSKYFIHLSRFEGVPQAVLEAYAAGCKLIVSNGCNLYDDIYKSKNVINYSEPNNIETFLSDNNYDEDFDFSSLSESSITYVFNERINEVL